MREEPPAIEREKPIGLWGIIRFLCLGIVVYLFALIIVPQQIDVKSEPELATVSLNHVEMCYSTPCTFSYSRIFPTYIRIEAPGYKAHEFLGHPFDRQRFSVFKETIKLDPLISLAETEAKLDLCQQERGELAESDDIDPSPCIRIPPIMPFAAQNSGHCHVVFNLSTEGIPFDIRLNGCTESIFGYPARVSVGQWRYLPKVTAGQPVVAQDLKTRVSFRLFDEAGVILPEPEDYKDEPHPHHIAVEFKPSDVE